MPKAFFLVRYFAGLAPGKIALWCYLIWYLVVVLRYFDPAPAIWLNSLGISAVVGLALLLSVDRARPVTDRWQTFRLFLMPFCVSSFAALIKGRGFTLVFPPSATGMYALAGSCAAFVLIVFVLKRLVHENRV
jgi:hypothetical protein